MKKTCVHTQYVYNLCQLITKNKFNRAIRISDQLQRQGLQTHQILVLKAYAVAMTKGYQEAISCLANQKGPLVDIARMQFHQMLGLTHSACQSIQGLQNRQKNSFIQALGRSLQIQLGRSVNKPVQFQDQYQKDEQKLWVLRSVKEEGQCVQKMNKLTSKYSTNKIEFQQGRISQQEFQDFCEVLKQEFQVILQNYRPKGKLATTIASFITFLTNKCSQIEINH